MKASYFIAKFKESVDIAMAKSDTPAFWKTQTSQLLATLQQSFGGKTDITDQELVSIASNFYAKLDQLAAANTAWKATGFQAAARPANHLAADLAKHAKILFGNIIHYVITPIIPNGSPAVYKAVLAQTKQASIYGYRIGDAIVCLDPEKIRILQRSAKRYENDAQVSMVARYAETTVRVSEGDSFAVAYALKSSGLNPVVLNMASPDVAGGGAEGGGFAQEESLYYRSNYFFGLDRNYNPGPAFYPLPEFGGVYTRDVQVIRNQQYGFCPPWSISLIACAAYVAPRVSDQTFREGTERKIEAMLRIAAAENHDCVVLGAFGCGAFKKDENTKVIVADLFAKVIRKPEFSGVFKNITFAIIRDHTKNLEVFTSKLTFDLKARVEVQAAAGVAAAAAGTTVAGAAAAVMGAAATASSQAAGTEAAARTTPAATVTAATATVATAGGGASAAGVQTRITPAAETIAAERKESEEETFRNAEAYANDILIYEKSLNQGMRVEDERRIRNQAYETYCQASSTGRTQLTSLMLAKRRLHGSSATAAAVAIAPEAAAAVRAAAAAKNSTSETTTAHKPSATVAAAATSAVSDRTVAQSLSQTIQTLRVNRANTHADRMTAKGQNRNAAFFSHYNNPDHTMRMDTANIYADAARELGQDRNTAFYKYYSLQSPEACRPLEKAIEAAQATQVSSKRSGLAAK